ncbi:MAG TPA: DUF2232 domain-containing protein [Candidatus Eremiobacteraeota bacterium]|nr:MAG: Tetratricopeptide repeat protein [bacterium ADurb.Bin363]HPZ06626.1 DUF2232 domain-containing protein [Candidatus Eremiobacteraeota bacterium]
MVKNNFTKRIAEGGLLVSLAFLFYFIGWYLPVLDIVRYISVTPIIIGVVRYGFKQGAEIMVATTLLIGILLTLLSGVEFFLSAGLIGLTLGISLKKNLSAFKTILYTFVSAFAGFSLNLLIYIALVRNADITADFKAVAEGLKSLVTWLNSLEVTGRLLNTITTLSGLDRSWMDMVWVTRLLVDLIPSLLIFLSFYYVIYLWIFNVYLMKKLNIELPSNAMLSEIPIFLIIPSWSLIFIVAGFILLGLSFYTSLRILEIAGVNLIAVMFIVCFSKGVFSINTYIRNKIPDNKNLRILVGFTITILEFTLFIPPVILWGIISIALGVQNAEIHEWLGSTYFKSGKLDLAIKHYKKSLELKPDRALSHQMLSLAYHKEGKKDLAIHHFKKSVELSKK